MDILAKIQCPPTNDPNVRNAHVGSFFANAKLNFLTPKSPMPLRKLKHSVQQTSKELSTTCWFQTGSKSQILKRGDTIWYPLFYVFFQFFYRAAFTLNLTSMYSQLNTTSAAPRAVSVTSNAILSLISSDLLGEASMRKTSFDLL